MKLSELIQLVGDENIQVQNLGTNLSSASKGKRDAKITFFASNAHADSLMREATGIPGQYLCLALWIPRDKMPAPRPA